MRRCGIGDVAHQRVNAVHLVPEWATLTTQPRAATITLRHLLTLTAAFSRDDAPRTPAGTAAAWPVRDAWARPLASAPGQTFAYDNSVVPLLTAVLEKATGLPLADYACQQLLAPIAMAGPAYQHSMAQLRTLDMAKPGQLYLQSGQRDGQPLWPEGFVDASVQAQSTGDRPWGCRMAPCGGRCRPGRRGPR